MWWTRENQYKYPHNFCPEHTWEDCSKPNRCDELSTTVSSRTKVVPVLISVSPAPRIGALLSDTMKVSAKNESWILKQMIEEAQRGGSIDSNVVVPLSSNIE